MQNAASAGTLFLRASIFLVTIFLGHAGAQTPSLVRLFPSPVKYGIAVGPLGRVHTLNDTNPTVHVYDSLAYPLFQWGNNNCYPSPGCMWLPIDLAVDSDGFVYVTDRNPAGPPAPPHRVMKFTSTGAFVTEWGDSAGSGPGEFSRPRGIAVDNTGNLYVADFDNDRIEKLTTVGTYVTEWGSTGSGDGQFNSPFGVAVDGNGFVYVTDAVNNNVQKFTSSGGFVTKWGTTGTGDGQLSSPAGIEVDGTGRVLVVDRQSSMGGTDRIHMFTTTGAFLGHWTVPEVGSAEGVTASADGNIVYVCGLSGAAMYAFQGVGVDYGIESLSWGRTKARFTPSSPPRGSKARR